MVSVTRSPFLAVLCDSSVVTPGYGEYTLYGSYGVACEELAAAKRPARIVRSLGSFSVLNTSTSTSRDVPAGTVTYPSAFGPEPCAACGFSVHGAAAKYHDVNDG